MYWNYTTDAHRIDRHFPLDFSKCEWSDLKSNRELKSILSTCGLPTEFISNNLKRKKK